MLLNTNFEEVFFSKSNDQEEVSEGMSGLTTSSNTCHDSTGGISCLHINTSPPSVSLSMTVLLYFTLTA